MYRVRSAVIVFLVVIVAFVTTTRSYAATESITYACSIDRSRLDWRYDADTGSNTVKFCNIPQFEEVKGDLVQVDVTIHGDTDTVQKVENKDVTPHTMTTQVQVNVDLFDSANSKSIMTLTVPTDEQSFSAAAHDGTVDYDGASGKTFATVTAENQKTLTYTNRSDLEQFIGTASNNFPVYAEASWSCSGSGNAACAVDTYARVDIMIVYTYELYAPDLVLNPCSTVDVKNGEDTEVVLRGANQGEVPTEDPIELTLELPACLSVVSTDSDKWDCKTVDGDVHTMGCMYDGVVPVSAFVPELPVTLRATDCEAENVTYVVKLQTGNEVAVSNNGVTCGVGFNPSEQPELTPTSSITPTSGDTCDDTKTQVSGHIFNDENKNGIQDADESDLANVGVEINDGKGNVYTVTTDENGDYKSCVEPGSIRVSIKMPDPDALPDPFVTTKNDDGSVNSSQVVTSAPGKVVLDDVGIAEDGSVLAATGRYVLVAVIGGLLIVMLVFIIRKLAVVSVSNKQ